MPETRLAKTRETLPEGYQFGDGRCGLQVRHESPSGFSVFNPTSRAVCIDGLFHDGRHWNVIEGEEHAPDRGDDKPWGV